MDLLMLLKQRYICQVHQVGKDARNEDSTTSAWYRSRSVLLSLPSVPYNYSATNMQTQLAQHVILLSIC